MGGMGGGMGPPPLSGMNSPFVNTPNMVNRLLNFLNDLFLFTFKNARPVGAHILVLMFFMAWVVQP